MKGQLKKFIWSLEYVTDNLKTQEMCIKAADVGPWQLKDISDSSDSSDKISLIIISLIALRRRKCVIR